MTKVDTSGWVWAVVAAGYVQASGLLLVGLAADMLPGARGAVGVDLVASDSFRPWGVLLVALGLVSFLGCWFVWLGQSYGPLALVAAGTTGTVVLALVGSWVALVVPLAIAVGLALLLATPALDHFRSSEGVA
ncbi:MAG TPA: hypothetical protein VM575_05365 [Nocardioides sp.]|jgi:hypothetical protein|nr:hypothetical protein [Nocardioides sp.]